MMLGSTSTAEEANRLFAVLKNPEALSVRAQKLMEDQEKFKTKARAELETLERLGDKLNQDRAEGSSELSLRHDELDRLEKDLNRRSDQIIAAEKQIIEDQKDLNLARDRLNARVTFSESAIKERTEELDEREEKLKMVISNETARIRDEREKLAQSIATVNVSITRANTEMDEALKIKEDYEARIKRLREITG